MRIAVACEGLDVAPNFSTCASLTFYTVDRGVIVECQNMPFPGQGGAEVVQLLSDLDVRVLIVCGIDLATASTFCDAGIEVVANACGTVREVVELYLTRTLSGADELCHLDDWDAGEDAAYPFDASIASPVAPPATPSAATSANTGHKRPHDAFLA